MFRRYFKISTLSWILINVFGTAANQFMGVTDLRFFELLAGSLIATIPALAGLMSLCLITRRSSSPAVRLIISSIGTSAICAVFVGVSTYYQLHVFSNHSVNLTAFAMPFALCAPPVFMITARRIIVDNEPMQ